MRNSRQRASGFTLVELLVVIGIIAVLVALVVPAVLSARSTSRKITCLNNLHQIGLGINAYAERMNGSIPFGPKAPPIMTAADFYPSTGAPTSLVSLMDGSPVGLGLLLNSGLEQTPQVFFCPDSDQRDVAEAELKKVGAQQAQSSYFYRHASVTRQFDPPGVDVLSSNHIKLDRLGSNRNGDPIRALVMDTQFIVSPDFAQFDVNTRTHHQQQIVNVLYSDGRAVSISNSDGRYNVTLEDYQSMTNAFSIILGAMEQADVAQ
jgi:prepilin-type N-terminal cleavage/methylation domain-containing protein